MMQKILQNLSVFSLSETQFRHPSQLHGVLHSYRVMSWVVVLSHVGRFGRDGRNAFFAAMVHDMGRTHDGVCQIHGAGSAKFILPKYKNLFAEYGVDEQDYKEIYTAVEYHSVSEEIEGHNVLKILKDADALDRVRIHPHQPNPSYLRFSFTEQFIPSAAKLLSFSEKLKNPDLQIILQKCSEFSKIKALF